MPLWQELLDRKSGDKLWADRENTPVQQVGAAAVVLWAFTLSDQGPEDDIRRRDGRRLNRTYTKALERGLGGLMSRQVTRAKDPERGRVGPAGELLVQAFATLALVDIAAYSEREKVVERARLAVTYLLSQRSADGTWNSATPQVAAWADLAIVVAAGRDLEAADGLSAARDEVVTRRSRQLRSAVMKGVNSSQTLDAFRAVVLLDIAGVWSTERGFAEVTYEALLPHFPVDATVPLSPEAAFWTWSAERALSLQQSSWNDAFISQLGVSLRNMKPDTHTPLSWEPGPFGTALDGAALGFALYASRSCSASSLEGRVP